MMTELILPRSTNSENIHIPGLENQPVKSHVQALLGKSLYRRSDLETGECNITHKGTGEKYKLSLLRSNDILTIRNVQTLIEDAFHKSEVEAQDVLMARLNGLTPFRTPDIGQQRVFTIKNSQGTLLSVLTGCRMDLLEEGSHDQFPDKTIFLRGYCVTDKSLRQTGFARELHISALLDAGLDAEKHKKQLCAVASESVSSAEAPWNSIGLQRVYAQSVLSPKRFTEFPYIQPPLNFDEATGNATSDAAPEHLMLDIFGVSLSKELVLDIVYSYYTQNYLWPEEAFGDNKNAHDTHAAYINMYLQRARNFLAQAGELKFMTKIDREGWKKKGDTINEHLAADLNRDK